MAKKLSSKDYAAAAAEMDALKDTGQELDGLVPVKAHVSKQPRAVISLRLTPEELSEFSDAARARNMTFSDFMRVAALAASRGDTNLASVAAIEEVQDKARELAAAVSRLRAG